ncbi:hypothetical protein QNO07_05595 [Streptomyces sp. 549]|uniref:hypothetical protein n=1 Tax=Streptomyces sp. 549 TaxID=3049076 RepID=UPI0024C31BE9|nr:hypothetical protein [Streptomyces sp. 549]MDK1472909.1 hypothetical protein [Streptomyces sp. 549]
MKVLKPRVVGGLLCLAALAASLTACTGGGGGEYALPERVCGVELAPEVVEPLLPAGESLKERGEVFPERYGDCWLVVDRADVLTVTFVPLDAYNDPAVEARTLRYSGLKPLERLPFPGSGVLGDQGSVVTARCGGAGPAYFAVQVASDSLHPAETGERREALEAFTVAYVSGARQENGCE